MTVREVSLQYSNAPQRLVVHCSARALSYAASHGANDGLRPTQSFLRWTSDKACQWILMHRWTINTLLQNVVYVWLAITTQNCPATKSCEHISLPMHVAARELAEDRSTDSCLQNEAIFQVKIGTKNPSDDISHFCPRPRTKFFWTYLSNLRSDTVTDIALFDKFSLISKNCTLPSNCKTRQNSLEILVSVSNSAQVCLHVHVHYPSTQALL